MQRKVNFNPGPAALPDVVLQQAAAAILEYNNTGLSILELPHRSKEFAAIIEECNGLVRELCGIDDRYEVLWMQGGGRMQFAMIPMNFLPKTSIAGFIDTDHWSAEAQEYAAYYGPVKTLASSKKTNYDRLPEWPEIPAELAYLHLTTNNTIAGTQWHNIPKTDVPLIADMSSDLFCCTRDYNQFDLFYAVAQKNIGAAGNTMVVVRKDMLARTVRTLPPMMSYRAHAKEKSVVNTANVFGVYTTLLMLRWTKASGIEVIEQENKQKANALYDALDNSAAFNTHVADKAHRSMMNVCFTTNTPEQEKSFLALCEQNNITGINGHRSVGGFRVSLYNAVTMEAVNKLVELVKEFA